MKRRLGILLALAVLGIAGVAVLAGTNPAGHPWFPKCVFHESTGFHCPGCGITRALHALLQGRFVEAFSQNPLVVLCLPFLLYGIVIEVAAYDWNCPKYITQRFTTEEIADIVGPLHNRIAELEAQLTS